MKINNIRCFVCFAVLFLSVNSAMASDWKFIAKSVTGNMYYDKSSIKEVSKNIISLYTKTVYNEYGGKNGFTLLKVMGKQPRNSDLLSHELVLFEFDCVNEKYKVSSVSLFDKDGNVLHSLPGVADKVEDIPPESFADRLKKIACHCAKPSKKKRK